MHQAIEKEHTSHEEHLCESCMSDEEPTREEHFCESCMSDEEPTSEEDFCKSCMMDFYSESQNESHVEEVNTEKHHQETCRNQNKNWTSNQLRLRRRQTT